MDPDEYDHYDDVEEDEFLDSTSKYPPAVRRAIECYDKHIDDVKAMAKKLTKKRAKTNEAAKTIKAFMNDQNLESLPVGRRTFKRKVKPAVKVNQKRFEASNLMSDAVKTKFIEENTVPEPKFQIS